MSGDPDLTTTEGVDEGSALPEPTVPTEPIGPGGDLPDDADVAPPVPPGAEVPPGPGQQLAEGEG